ncbi:hypothetical protein IE077_000694 [Cardiosporidium cionae]|uniref:Uncharacterized protein n=1 Tax=Cardiosporidium cionae TaxID=476202 RepID=A0ABQ7J402_9APIC|nr:hypothetical protein IE077_000694 [Cardiosporidium cionae]|eukprot:KAF8817817.1 hypothetical protein IE077_000694 [Cardiosporidium cionae]
MFRATPKEMLVLWPWGQASTAISAVVGNWRYKCYLVGNKRLFHGYYCKNGESVRSGMRISAAIVDTRRVRCRGGKGGAGSISYVKHACHKMMGPGLPSGGGGGAGGSVIVEAVENVSNLSHIPGFVNAENGGYGGTRRKNGAIGKDYVITVPLGCLVWKETEQMNRRKRSLLMDMEDQHSRRVLVAHGGKGGCGNNFNNPHHEVSSCAGEDVVIVMLSYLFSKYEGVFVAWHDIELKSIADVGLVGLPNSGKSTLLAAISPACPKIAPYPFTTLAPHIGRISYKDGSMISVADIPGIIAGAHANVGLGFAFLRHIERTSLLALVLDFANDQLDAYQTFLCLRYEIAAYNSDLATKPFCIVANKCDILPSHTLRRVDNFWLKLQEQYPGVKLIPISARFGDGIQS